jgi:plastocyanin
MRSTGWVTRKVASVGMVVALAGLLLASPGTSSAVKIPALRIFALPGSFATGFYPPRIVILQGQVLNFTNLDVAGHDIQPQAGYTGFGTDRELFLTQTTSAHVELLKPGTYKFWCTFHQATMKGVLIVKKL